MATVSEQLSHVCSCREKASEGSQGKHSASDHHREDSAAPREGSAWKPHYSGDKRLFCYQAPVTVLILNAYYTPTTRDSSFNMYTIKVRKTKRKKICIHEPGWLNKVLNS